MRKKPKPKKRVSDYKPVFTSAEHKLMQNYGVGNLMDEVGVNRIMIIRTLDKMNQEMKNLTFKDHIDAMRAVSYTTGRISNLLEIREKLYKPYEDVEKQYREFFDAVVEANDKLGEELYGSEVWGQMQTNNLRKAMGLPEIPIDPPESFGQQKSEDENGTEQNG